MAEINMAVIDALAVFGEVAQSLVATKFDPSVAWCLWGHPI